MVALGEFMRTESDHVLGSKRLGTSLKAEHTIPFRLSVYAKGAYYEDPPAGIAHQITLNIGAIVHIVHSDRRSLALLLSMARLRENRITIPNRDFLGAETGLEYSAKVNDSVAFEGAAGYIRDFSDAANWRARTSTSITAAINKHLAFKFSHQLYRNKPDVGKRATDQTMLASLVVRWPMRKHR
jgi:hypothetical protein